VKGYFSQLSSVKNTQPKKEEQKSTGMTPRGGKKLSGLGG
jgi:hypothetical protein